MKDDAVARSILIVHIFDDNAAVMEDNDAIVMEKDDTVVVDEAEIVVMEHNMTYNMALVVDISCLCADLADLIVAHIFACKFDKLTDVSNVLF
ncbi:hypothetical protein RclHR1_00940004 [Rhizophagus clarus]|uniref:Uncharacterized protein n=1 Tax=Rhizophagus clarus TaxID=94130 RepID=A0A2Z6SAE2_9GLOM|nr:hypothetical protein RclHR1_00940004 [Rhizophagus clarus]